MWCNNSIIFLVMWSSLTVVVVTNGVSLITQEWILFLTYSHAAQQTLIWEQNTGGGDVFWASQAASPFFKSVENLTISQTEKNKLYLKIKWSSCFHFQYVIRLTCVTSQIHHVSSASVQTNVSLVDRRKASVFMVSPYLTQGDISLEFPVWRGSRALEERLWTAH